MYNNYQKYNPNKSYHSPDYVNTPNMYNMYGTPLYPYSVDNSSTYSNYENQFSSPYSSGVTNYQIGPQFDDEDVVIRDYGPNPFVVNINEATIQNDTFRTALWTGEHLQITLMSLNVGEEIGIEIHPDHDQFLRIEMGDALVKMGDRQDRLDFQENATDDYAIVIPAGKWHNIINTGDIPLKLYSIYAPPKHPFGTVHKTKADAEAAK